jgi:transposase
VRPSLRVFPSDNETCSFLRRRIPLCAFRVPLSRRQRQALAHYLHTAQRSGQWHDVPCRLAILAVTEGQSCDPVALTRRVPLQTVHQWVRRLLVTGPTGLQRTKPSGRPSQRTTTQQHARAKLPDAGPVPAGDPSAGWRSPMLQPVIYERFGVFDNGFDMTPLLQHLGLSYQKAALVSDHLHEEKRQVWCPTTWPQLVTAAKARAAWLRCGDEAACPQGGPLAYTWARRGHQPMVKTAGKRQGDTVFGLLAYCTGRFWYQGQAGRLNAATYIAVRTRVWAQTTQPILLIQEGARDHTSAARPRFFGTPSERLTVFPWPSDAPDDHPLEKLGKTGKKAGTPRHYCPTFEALTDTVEHALLKFAKTPAEMLALCRLPTA